MSEYNAEKKLRRETLSIRQKKNMKYIVIGIAMFTLCIAIGNHYWRAYQEKNYHDKEVVMNINKRIIYDIISQLEYYNQLMTDCIYNLPMDTSYEKGKLDSYRRYDSLSDFRYDSELYRIDKFSGMEYIYDVKETLRNLLTKKTPLTVEEKEGIFQIIHANEAIIKDYNRMIKERNKDEYQEEMRYLYYYKGEILYMLTNAIEVHTEDISFHFLTKEDEEVQVNDWKEEEKQFSIKEQEVYAKKMYQLIFEQEKQLNIQSSENNAKYEASSVMMEDTIFSTDEFMETEAIYTSTGGIIQYSFDAEKYKIDNNQRLTKKELENRANEFVKKLKQPLLTLITYNQYEVEEGKNNRHVFYYIMKKGSYIEERTAMQLVLLDDGKIQSVSIENPLLLVEKILPKKEPISREKVKEKLPANVKIEEIYYLAGENTYYVLFKDTKMLFVAKIQGETGELLGINIVKENTIWWK